VKPLTPHLSYTLEQRIGHAEQAILFASAGSWLDQTSCTHIARTYGISHLTVDLKRLKGSLFPEFALNGDGK
jgi:hypothetical protein